MKTFMVWLIKNIIREIKRVPLNIKCFAISPDGFFLPLATAPAWLVLCLTLFQGLGICLFLIPTAFSFIVWHYYERQFQLWCFDCANFNEEEFKKPEFKSK